MRPWIIATLLGWMAILAVLAYVPTPAFGSPPEVAEKWLDFGRTAAASLAGAALGAGLAYYFNLSIQSRLRNREEIASGSYALTVMRRQYWDFQNAREKFFEVLTEARKKNPRIPDFEHMRPFFHALAATADLDFRALSFVFEHKNGQRTFAALHDADQAHRFLINTIEAITAASLKRLEKLEAAGYKRSGEHDYAEHLETLGPRLQGQLSSICETAVAHFSEDEIRFLLGHRLLREAMIDRFGVFGLPDELEAAPSSYADFTLKDKPG